MLYVFGYGSLIWNPGFTYTSSVLATAHAWKRRLWQGSPDHRGTPEFLGRVVTLVADQESSCRGRLYEVERGNESEVLDYLDLRESGGYQREQVRCTLPDGKHTSALTYIAGESNPNYLGHEPRHQTISCILKAQGQSGSNWDYVIKLDESLRRAGIDDSYIGGIAEELRRAAEKP